MERKTVIVDGKEVNAARLLAALHNNTRPLGMGFLHDLKRDMTVAEAEAVLAQLDHFAFDYFYGRPLKVGADKDGVITSKWGYDRDAGEGAFDRAVSWALDDGEQLEANRPEASSCA